MTYYHMISEDLQLESLLMRSELLKSVSASRNQYDEELNEIRKKIQVNKNKKC